MSKNAQFHKFTDVVVSKNNFVDVWLLTEPNTELKKVGKEITFDQLSSHMNGLARMVYFKKDESGSKIKCIFEGHVKGGHFNGYAR